MNFWPPNKDQVNSWLRWAVSAFGMFIAGWFASKGWFTTDQVMAVLNSPTVIGIAGSLIMMVIGLITHTDANKVASVNAMSNVAGVITTPDAEGQALAAAVPANTVVAAGTTQAAAVAKAA